MRISPTDICRAITNPNYRVPTQRNGGPSPVGTLRKAIRLYHEFGLDAAMTHIESGLADNYWREKGGLTQAKAARQMLDTYIDLASGDSRPAAPAAAYGVHALGHIINADLDVLLVDPRGYVGRLCLVASLGRQLNPDELALVAAAPFRGLSEELDGRLFDNVAVEMEVWQLRYSTTAIIRRDQAEQAWPALLQHLKRATAGPAAPPHGRSP